MSDLLTVFGINWKLLIVQAINFGLLMVLLWYFLYTPVLRLVDERRKKIAEGVKNADDAAEALAASETEGNALLADAALRAEETKRQALKQSEKEIARAAMLAAEKILREKSA